MGAYQPFAKQETFISATCIRKPIMWNMRNWKRYYSCWVLQYLSAAWFFTLIEMADNVIVCSSLVRSSRGYGETVSRHGGGCSKMRLKLWQGCLLRPLISLAMLMKSCLRLNQRVILYTFMWTAHIKCKLCDYNVKTCRYIFVCNDCFVIIRRLDNFM